MISIILSVLLGIVFAVVAKQNTTLTPVDVFGITFVFPLYVVAAFSFLFGIGVTLIFSLFGSIASFFQLQGSQNKVGNLQRANERLQAEVVAQKRVTTSLQQELEKTRDRLRAEKIDSTKKSLRNFANKIKASTS